MGTVSVVRTFDLHSHSASDGGTVITLKQVTRQLERIGVATEKDNSESILRPREHPSTYPYFRITIFPVGDPAIGKRYAPPDSRGIWWSEQRNELSSDPPFWAGVTWYRNVCLTWFTDRQTVDGQWERIDAALKELAV